jgi:hypothetical protein
VSGIKRCPWPTAKSHGCSLWWQILHYTVKKQGFTITADAAREAVRILSKKRAMPNFGNARDLTNILADVSYCRYPLTIHTK